MCEANIYLDIKNGEEPTLFLEAADTVVPEGENVWRITSIFGEQKTIHGKIQSMRLVEHRIVFETLEP
ncbi:MAG: CooT family nickel-binding protein [Deltaproteobacteria bacterium]|jgi:predicted RNA-binding protein|nr:CooT family nickel-binding protein [Deltaproteobacteria bacterium]